MTKNLPDLSGKINPLWINVVQSIAVVTTRLRIPYFVVGATARDLILEHGFGVKPSRATMDVDFGVQVPDWNRYERLMSEFITSGQFTATKQQHRLIFEGTLPVDILPFGPIATPDARITWPRNPEFIMNTMGFDEAYMSSALVRLRNEPVLEVRVSVPQSLAIMKLISWDERVAGGGKDADDLLLIMSRYLDLGNGERLAGESADLLEVPDFDYERTGARLLGRDMAASCRPETAGHLLEILARETGEKERYKLVEAMIGRDLFVEGGEFERVLGLLENVRMGFEERMKR